MSAPRWYMINARGMATLCADEADALSNAADADLAWPHMSPHRAVQLVEAQELVRDVIARLERACGSGTMPVEVVRREFLGGGDGPTPQP